MRRWVALAAGVLASSCARQDEGPKPGAHHEHLAAQAGTWDYTAVFTMGPEKAEFKGVQTNRLEGGGLWLVQENKGEFGGAPFWGHGMAGYDAARKKYTMVWADSMSDYLQVGEGECSDGGKTLTMEVKIKDPADPNTWSTMKEVTRMIDKDTIKLTFSFKGPDGKEETIGDITYKRKK